MNKTILLIFVVSLLSPSVFAGREVRCTAVVVDGGPSFSATSALDVDVLLQFKNADAKELADGDHVAEVRFFGPQGFLYESRMVPLTSDGAKAGTTKILPGYRRGVKRQLVATGKSGKGLEARVSLPVAATSIVENSLYGTWRGEVRLDDSETQCAEPAIFTITQ